MDLICLSPPLTKNLTICPFSECIYYNILRASCAGQLFRYSGECYGIRSHFSSYVGRYRHKPRTCANSKFTLDDVHLFMQNYPSDYSHFNLFAPIFLFKGKIVLRLSSGSLTPHLFFEYRFPQSRTFLCAISRFFMLVQGKIHCSLKNISCKNGETVKEHGTSQKWAFSSCAR